MLSNVIFFDQKFVSIFHLFFLHFLHSPSFYFLSFFILFIYFFLSLFFKIYVSPSSTSKTAAAALFLSRWLVYSIERFIYWSIADIFGRIVGLLVGLNLSSHFTFFIQMQTNWSLEKVKQRMTNVWLRSQRSQNNEILKTRIFLSPINAYPKMLQSSMLQFSSWCERFRH